MNDTTVEHLKSQLANALAQLRQAEEDGAELATLYEAKVGDLAGEIARLRRGRTQGAHPLCRGCEIQSWILGAIASLAFGTLWFHAVPADDGDSGSTLFGLCFASLPLFAVLTYWQWVRFCLKYHWVSRTDNDIYRNLQTRWNGFLGRMRLR
jgi:hypothetical protein